MARIQKKKPVAKKKKTRHDADDGDAAENRAGAPTASTAGKSVTAGAEGARDKKQKRVAATKKASPAGQSAVLRLIDRYFGNWIQFLREVKIELSKVTWPSRKQTVGSTVVVIVFVFVIAFFLGMVDIGLSSLLRLIL